MQALLKKCFGPAVDAAVPDVGSTPTTRAALTKSPSRLASELKAAKTAKLSRPRHVKLLGDVAAAVGAAVCVTPLCMMVDVAITQAAAGEMSLPQALLAGAVDAVTDPLTMVQSTVFQLCLFVYVCTYGAANLTRAVCELYLYVNPVLPVLVAGTLGNMLSCVYKDARLAELLGKGAAAPMPLAGYLLFVLRDILANTGGFTLPAFVEPLLAGKVKDAKTTAQLLVPAAINLVSSPVHLLGLSLYNNPGFGALEHVAGVAAVYVTVTGTRILKGFCAFGIGGVSNLYLRGKLGSA